MVTWNVKKGRKSTGGKYRADRRRDKILASKGGEFTGTKVAEENTIFNLRTKGGDTKTKMKAASIVHVLDKATKKITKATIKSVKDNSANRLYARRNVLTKGAIVETDKGSVKITSRPGQSGSLSGTVVK